MQHFPDTVTLAPGPTAIVNRLIAEFDDFAHLQEAAPQLLVLLSARTIVFRGGRANAVIIQPRWQGPLGMVAEVLLAQLGRPVLDGEDPEYVILIDAAIWSVLDDEGRERLMFHELSHLQPQEDEFGVPRRSKVTGKPLLRLVPHDAEVFNSELERYGPYVVGIEATCEAIAEGLKAVARRQRVHTAA